MDEHFAQAILFAAIKEARADEFLTCLFDGGSATIDPEGRLVLASNGVIQQLMGNT